MLRKNSLRMRVPPDPSNILWNNLDHSRKSFCRSVCVLVVSLILILGIYCLAIFLLHAYRSNQIDKEPKVNPVVLKYCSSSTTFAEVRHKTEAFLKWSVANPSLVEPSFLQNKKTIERLELFGITPEYDVSTLQEDPDQSYDEFLDEWDNTTYLEACFCHWQYASKSISNAEAANYCGLIYNKWFKILLITVLSGLVITFVNVLAVQVVPWLVRRIPLENLTVQQNVSILITLVFLYINSVVAPIAIHSPWFLNMFHQDEPLLGSSMFPNLVKVYDFDHEWYQEVGLKITVSLLFNLLVCSLVEMARVKMSLR